MTGSSVVPYAGTQPMPVRRETRSIKTADGGSFVRIHVEDGEQLSDLQKISDLFRQMQQFQASIPVFDGRKAADELAEAGFQNAHVKRLRQQRSTTRERALEVIRSRAFSTFDLLPADEYAAGLERAEAELPERFEASFAWLLAAASL